MTEKRKQTLYLISDGTCRTCDTVVKAVMVQFEGIEVKVVRKANVRRATTVRSLIKKAARDQALVFYTLVTEEARHAIEDSAREQMVPIVDLLGPVMVGLYDLFYRVPLAKPGILHQSDKDHNERIDAVEYTLSHDDGCRERELSKADVVLVGVSRSSKSTTCFYLGYSGIRAANVPLFADREPPDDLIKLDSRRVIGLTVNPYRLRSVRESRIKNEGIDPNSEYGEKAYIARELRAGDEQMARYGWRVIDVSYKAIEEIAREVIQLLEESGIKLRGAHSSD